MKRIMSIILIILMLITALAGCQSQNKQNSVKKDSDNNKISIVATTFPEYDFARQIAGDKANITMLLSPGAESHSFEPTPQDIIKIQNCDVFIYVGGENDKWVDTILGSMDTSNMKIISLLDCVDAVGEEIKEGMEAEKSNEGTGKTEYDEHVWTSPKNVILIANVIREALCEADAGNTETYRSNTESYVVQLNQLDADFKAVVDNASRKTIVFGDRFPLRYFADEYGLDYFAAFPGCSTETEPSAATIAFLIEKVKEENIPVVFKIELSNGNIAQTISESTGAKVLTFYSCHNVSKKDFENGATYLSLMQKNVEALKEALN